MCFTQVGSGLTHKHQTRQERLAKDKPSSLLQKFVNYGRRKFSNIGHRFDPSITTEHEVFFNKLVQATLLNKSLCLAPALGVTRFIIVTVMKDCGICKYGHT